MLEGFFQRVEPYAAPEGVFGAFFFYVFHECLRKWLSAAGTTVEVDFHRCYVYAFKQCCNSVIVRRNALEAKRVDSFCQDVKSFGVSSLHIGSVDFLTGEPVIVVAGATDIRVFARQRVCSIEPLYIFRTIHRLKVKAFICTPNQLFVKGSAFQVGFYLGLPFGGRHRRKLVKQFFFIFCHG